MASIRFHAYFKTILLSLATYCFFIYVVRIVFPPGERPLQTTTTKSSKCAMQQEAIGPPVFLVETKVGKLHLTSREACALEAAARLHPRSDVTLYTVNSHFNSSDIFTETIVLNLPNVHIHHLNLSQLFEGSPLSTWYKKNSLNGSAHPVQHLSDAVRLALLWKRGGIYMDTDAISLKDHSPLRNSLGMESHKYVVGGVMVFDQLAPFLYDCMTELAINHNGRAWAGYGPFLLTKMVKQVCNINGTFKYWLTISCPGVTLQQPNVFYLPSLRKLFKKFDPKWFDFPNSYSVHLYANQTRNLKAKPGDGTFIDVIAQRNCPTAYQIMVQLNYI